jgi:hypothetical protein
MVLPDRMAKREETVQLVVTVVAEIQPFHFSVVTTLAEAQDHLDPEVLVVPMPL